MQADDRSSWTLEQAERDHVLRVCNACGWKIKGAGGAAERLGLNASTLYFRLKKLGITRPGDTPRRDERAAPGSLPFR
jgi:formate hydrogenlyase transcriptional activator